MNYFKNIFGIDSSAIQKSCVLAPCISKDLLAAFCVGEMTRGKLYACAQGHGFTLIHARMGACFVGDLVLYLKETACRQVFLFGSCGSTGVLDVGRLIVPFKCFGRESFSSLLFDADKKPWPVFYPDKGLFERFFLSSKDVEAEKVTAMTLPSLKLEEGLSEQFKNDAVDVVEMECSAFFASASKIMLPALALFYVSDVIGKKPFYEEMSDKDQQTVKTAMVFGIKVLCDFMKTSLND